MRTFGMASWIALAVAAPGCYASAIDRQALHAEATARVRSQLGDGAGAQTAEQDAESLRLRVRLYDEVHPGGRDWTGLLR